jgi:hypothetical protein
MEPAFIHCFVDVAHLGAVPTREVIEKPKPAVEGVSIHAVGICDDSPALIVEVSQRKFNRTPPAAKPVLLDHGSHPVHRASLCRGRLNGESGCIKQAAQE